MTIVFKDKDTHAEDDPGIKLLGTQLPVRLLFPHRMLEIGERLPITAPSGGFVCVGKPAPLGNGLGAPGGATLGLLLDNGQLLEAGRSHHRRCSERRGAQHAYHAPLGDHQHNHHHRCHRVKPQECE